jgi:ubiquitin-protein ligase
MSLSAAIKRLPREIQNVSDLSGQGIYYVSDSDTMLKGNALIIGDEDSAYPFVTFFYRFEFPSDYPFSPPKVTFLTTDNQTRFHPNLYVSGKVCLSILGTYTGPSWQSTMSLSMVLLSLKALMDNNPITHEPGWEKYTLQDTRALHYRNYVRAKAVEWTVHELRRKYFLRHFEDEVAHILPTLKEKMAGLVREEAAKEDTHYSNLPYSMAGSTKWKMLSQLLLVDGKP